ncbi:hypothetical protein MKY96_32505 [Paenibacillus sp. FSL R7-0302]|uniref:hypothetical protein n=1 Tax=Paenibacillus sp. FSL R7-0302 TaxID=2921681 RepID=UPI0030F621C3
MAKRKNHLLFVKEKKEGVDTPVQLIGSFGREMKAWEVGRKWQKWGYKWTIRSMEQHEEYDPGIITSRFTWIGE